MLKSTITLAILTQTLLAPIAHAQTNHQIITEDNLSVMLSEGDYSDLRAYMNRAREILEDTVKSSHELGGEVLHARLLAGIRAALEETKLNSGLIDIKNEKMLFTAVLSRAVVLNDIFVKAADQEKQSEALTSAASVVLLGSIRLALGYYQTSDNPRFETKLIPSPDWAVFARDQIPTMVRISSLATTLVAKRDILMHALGWAQADLNRSANRRDYATTIVNLGTMRTDLERSLRSPNEAQQFLGEVAQQLTVKLTPQGQTPPAAPSGVVFPQGNFPSDPATGPAWSPFPFVELHKWQDLDEFNWGYTRVANPDSTPYRRYNDYQHDIFFNAGAGAGAQYVTGSPTAGGSSGFAAVSLRSHNLFMWNMGNPMSWDEPKAPLEVLGASIYLAGNATLGADFAGKPVYNFRFTGAPNAFGIAGGWIAVEGSQFGEFKEFIVRGGWGPQVPILIGQKSYILLRVGPGGSGYMGGPNNMPFRADFGLNAQALLRIAKFVINIEYDGDFGNNDQGGRGDRHKLMTYLSIPLGLIFPNDALRIEADWTHYRAHEDHPAVNIYRAGGYYEVRF